MAIIVGIDLGTTTISALALDASTGRILACETEANDAQITSPKDKRLGRSEWDAGRIIEKAYLTLKSLSQALGARLSEVAGLGVTGQQHDGHDNSQS